MSSNYISLYIKNRRRFEIILAKLNPFIGKVSRADRALANSYSALKEDAHSIIGVMESHGRRLSENDFAYYVERLKNITSFFEREMKTEKDYFSDEKKPTAADNVGEIAAKLAALFEAAPPAELDDENDAQTAERDEAADDTTAGAPISDEDILRLPYERPITGRTYGCWEKLSSKERTKVRARETLAMWCDINDAFRRKSGGHDYAKAYEVLDSTGFWFYSTKDDFRLGLHKCLFSSEKILRKKINKVIDAIPGFRDSKEFKTIIEQYPTYKDIKQ